MSFKTKQRTHNIATPSHFHHMIGTGSCDLVQYFAAERNVMQMGLETLWWTLYCVVCIGMKCGLAVWIN